MGIEVVHTIGSGEDYSTLVAWSAAQGRNIDTANEDAVAELVGEHTNGTTTLDFAADGWVTSGADNTIIRAASGYEYSTSASADGTIDNTKALARWGATTNDCFLIDNSTNHHDFLDIQIHWNASVSGAKRMFDIRVQSGSSTSISIKRCLLYIDTTSNQVCTGPFLYNWGTDCSSTINLWMSALVYHNSGGATSAATNGLTAVYADGSSGTHTFRAYGCTLLAAEHSSSTNNGLWFSNNSATTNIKPYIINTVHYSVADTNAVMTILTGSNPPTVTTNLNNASGSGAESQTVVAADWETVPGTVATTADGGTLDLNIVDTGDLYQTGSTLNIGATLNGITPASPNYSIGAFGLVTAIPLGTATSTFAEHFAAGMLGVGQTGVTAPTIGNGTGSISLGGTINGVGQVFTNNTYGDLVGAQFTPWTSWTAGRWTGAQRARRSSSSPRPTPASR
jgi:hypothetical protein